MSSQSRARAGQILFRVGQFFLVAGVVFFIVSIATAYWVVRPSVDFLKENIDPNKTQVTVNYGIFVACRQTAAPNTQDEGQVCDSLWASLTSINASTARYVQFLMCLAAILYTGSLSLEIIQCLPMDRFRNFLAKNRVVEVFASIATVLVLQGMVIFAGEIKNKADRVSGQEDEEPGYSYVLAMVGLLLTILGVTIVLMFRELPVPGPDKVGGSWLRSDPSTQTK